MRIQVASVQYFFHFSSPKQKILKRPLAFWHNTGSYSKKLKIVRL